MIHEAVGLVVSMGASPSEEAINATYGPAFGGYAQASARHWRSCGDRLA